MKGFTRPFTFAVGLLLAASAPSTAATISLNSVFLNVSLESVTSGCPTFWSCTNLSVTQPTSAQYPLPSNGLSGGLYVPSGSNAAFSPVTGSVTGLLSQSVAGQQYLAGNTYTLDFWFGNPLGGAFPNRIDIQFTTTNTTGALGPVTNNLCDTGGRFATLSSGAQSGVDNGTQCQFSLNTAPAWIPTDGDWRMYTASFTTDVTIPGNLGILFSVFPQQAAENGVLMHLDMVGPAASVQAAAVPEPATLTLFGLGLGAVARLRKRNR